MTEAESHDIESEVCDIVADSLGVERSAVHANSILMAELGAESLDFLDIVFRLEQHFGIQVTRGEMERAARGDMSDEEFAPDGILGERGLARLRELMPEAAERIKPGLRPGQILTLFSVRTFASIVRGKLQGQTMP